MEGFTIEGWDDFVENFSKFVDKWADKKKILLQRMANIYHGEVIPHVPVDTSRLVDSITIFGEGIPHDFVEVGTNVEYAVQSRLKAGEPEKEIARWGKLER